MAKHFEPAKPGTKLMGFNVVAEIGKGAASIIYAVQDPRTKQVYALKHIEKREPRDQRFLDQAKKEYEVGSRVHHDAIRGMEKIIKQRERLVNVREIFLLMEYVDGVSVEKNPPGKLVDAVSIFKQTAAGLVAMHEAGYIHADMKPNNIVVDEKFHVKVIDLGQACASGTIKERIQGTPDYIAPEQVHRQAITPQTDIYNLGATMYWVLTKTHIPTALPKDNSLVSSLDPEMIERPRPIRELNSDVPERLANLIMHCVEVEPDSRPRTMREVHATLDLVYAMLLAESEPAQVADDE